MKIKNIVTAFLVIVISASCMPTKSVNSSNNSGNPSALQTLTPLALSTIIPVTPDSTVELSPLSLTRTAGFVDDWRLRSIVLPAVREYFYYRKKAIISGNVNELWARYPDLKNEVDTVKGINAEESSITTYQALEPFDGNVDLQAYERVKVKMQGDKAEVLVHGTMIFLWIDENGDFQDTGGEIEIILFLKKNGENWNVYKTDQYRQGAE